MCSSGSTGSGTSVSSLPPLIVPMDHDGGGSYDTDEMDAIQAFTEGWSAYDPDMGDDDGEW